MKLKNEVLVGLVVVAALVVLAVGGYWLTGRPWTGEQREIVGAFRSVGLLTEGSEVKFRGVRVGRVEEIELSPRGLGVFVTMSVDPEVTLPPDAGVLLSPESFFGDWQASIVEVGDHPEMEFTTAPRPGVLPGATLPDITELTAVAARIADDLETLSDRVSLAFTEETAIKIRETVENLAAISEQLEGFVDQQTEVYAAVSQNALQATRNIEQATAQVEQVTTQVSAAIDQGELEAIIRNVRITTNNLQQFTAQLDTITAGVPGLIEQFEVTLQTATNILEQLEPAAAEVQPTIVEAREAVVTLNELLADVQAGGGTLGRLLEDPALYEETQRAIAALQRFLADIQANPRKYVGEVRVF